MKRLRMFKWFEVVILSIVLLVGSTVIYSIAADFGAPTGKVVEVTFKPERTFAVLTANTMGLTSASNDIGFTASQFAVSITLVATTLGTQASSLLGSIDGTNFYTMVVNSATATPTIYWTTGKPVRYVKGKYASNNGGNSGITMSMTVTAGGN